MSNVMISYSHKDSDLANKIVSILEENNIKCWIDHRDAIPGNNYAGSIVRAIKGSDFVILILSEHSMGSAQVLNEVNSAVNNNTKIITFKIDDQNLSDDMEYYLGTTHWLMANSDSIDTHIPKLLNAIGTNQPTDISLKETISILTDDGQESVDKMKCRMVKYNDLIKLGYTSSKIATQLVENDYITCNGIGEENEGYAEQWERFLKDSNDTFQYLINGENKIVGDWSILCLTEETYKKAEKGELVEVELNDDNTELIVLPGEYYGYILAIEILPEYRSVENYNLIIDSFLAQLEKYSDEGVFFKKWCMNVFGRDVEALVKKLGFTFKCNNKVFGKIYTCDFIPLPQVPLLNKRTRLIENYGKL